MAEKCLRNAPYLPLLLDGWPARVNGRLVNATRMRCPVCWQAVQATWDDRRVQHHLVIGRSCEMSGRAFRLCYPLTVDPKVAA